MNLGNVYGVGFLGCGPVTQAIHVPSIRHYSELRIEMFMDVDASLSSALAMQHEAKSTSDEDELINNKDIHVVVIGSPNSHHARQIIKACEAGKKVVLAEKPLATTAEESVEIISAAKKSGTRIVVGAMHAFDETFLRALAIWSQYPTKATSVLVNCYLPSNDEMVDYATNLLKPTEIQSTSIETKTPSRIDHLQNGILGLALHDIPLIREFVPEPITLINADYLSPWGYLLQGHTESCAVQLVGQMPGQWGPDWSLVVTSDERTFSMRFQPSYVLNQSCVVQIIQDGLTQEFSSTTAAYLSEWKEVVDLLTTKSEPRYSLERISSDFSYAINLINQLSAFVEEKV